MYDVICHEIVDAGVAKVLETSVYTNMTGKAVDEDEWFGKIQDIEIAH